MDREQNQTDHSSIQTRVQLLDTKQAAIFLGVHVTTIWRWKKEGRMPEPVKQLRRKSYWSIESLRKSFE